MNGLIELPALEFAVRTGKKAALILCASRHEFENTM
jgi:hypothetical protein